MTSNNSNGIGEYWVLHLVFAEDQTGPYCIMFDDYQGHDAPTLAGSAICTFRTFSLASAAAEYLNGRDSLNVDPSDVVLMRVRAKAAIDAFENGRHDDGGLVITFMNNLIDIVEALTLGRLLSARNRKLLYGLADFATFSRDISEYRNSLSGPDSADTIIAMFALVGCVTASCRKPVGSLSAFDKIKQSLENSLAREAASRGV